MLSPLPFSDGPIDATMDVSHLNEKEKARRRALYQRWFKRNGKTVTASGQKLQFDLETFSNFKAKRVKYIQEGQACVAEIACQVCMEINTCRPEGSPPFICLVKATQQYTREDGTVVCAMCCGSNSPACQAILGERMEKVPKYENSVDLKTLRGLQVKDWSKDHDVVEVSGCSVNSDLNDCVDYSQSGNESESSDAESDDWNELDAWNDFKSPIKRARSVETEETSYTGSDTEGGESDQEDVMILLKTSKQSATQGKARGKKRKGV